MSPPDSIGPATVTDWYRSQTMASSAMVVVGVVVVVVTAAPGSMDATVVGAGLAVPGSLRCNRRTQAAPTTATEITATMRAVRRSIHRK